MFKIILTIDQIKIPIIVKPSTVPLGNQRLFSLSDDKIEKTLKDLGLEKVPLHEILPKFYRTTHDIVGHECAICNQDYTLNEYIRRLPCQHIFHKKCIDKWLGGNPTCAICRGEII